MADYSFDDRFETVAITWSQPEAAVMLSMFDFYGIPAFALGRRHVSAQGPILTALQGIQIRVALGSLNEALDLLAEVAERPAAVRPYAFGLPGLYRIIVVLALLAATAMPVALSCNCFSVAAAPRLTFALASKYLAIQVRACFRSSR